MQVFTCIIHHKIKAAASAVSLFDREGDVVETGKGQPSPHDVKIDNRN
ncbi:hypothetical protein ABIE13_000697 [Ottowia thiooxydans]|uniref:Uncharacterized protein n=1 Tax=Ottowia thiooxydans TaxID=219182 RepID=A0ABV2Q3K7_9BURK